METDLKNNAAEIDDNFTTRNTDSNYDEAEMEKVRLWLSNYSEPLNEIVEKWHLTALYRKNTIESNADVHQIFNVFEKWPLYKSTNGHTLVAIDFSYIYPNVEEQLFSMWDNFKLKITDVYTRGDRN